MRSRFALAVAVPLLLILPPGAASAEPAGAPSPALTSTAATVTLLTGDRVTVTPGSDGTPAVAVTAAQWPGRRVDFRTTYGPDSVRVVPSDVAHLIPDVLDPRLFDVSALLRAGLDDRSTASLPLIVQRAPSLAPAAAMRTVRELSSIGASAVQLPKATAGGMGAQLAATRAAGQAAVPLGGASRVWLDDLAHAGRAPDPGMLAGSGSGGRLDRNLTQIGAPSAWAAGLSGAGVKVAVLDTGVDATHPDLAGRVAAARDFTGGPDATDRNGHGTHVASILAGSGAAAAGARRGVAFGSTLLVGKVLDDRGTGQFSEIIAGMEWAVAQGARIVNMSLGSDGASTGRDPLSLAVDALTASHGALFVTSAGNRGPGATTVSGPAAAEAALAVGAVDDRDRLAGFSSRGPRLGDHAVKPEIVSPGVDIVAARAAGTSLGELAGSRYTRLSGTSMAAPHVAGAAALLAQRHPQWTADNLRAALIGAAAPIGAGAFEAGSGRLDLATAVPQTVLAEPAVLSFGFASYPQAQQPALVRPFTVVNTGTTALTLTLRADLRTPAGRVAPAGMLAVEPARLSIPPGGKATATVTLAVALGGFGAFAGTVTATPTGGGPSVRVPVGVVKESTRHVLNLRALDRNDTSQIPEMLATFINLRDITASPPDPVVLLDGRGTVRLQPGHYAVTAAIPTLEEGDGGGDSISAAAVVVTSVSIVTLADVNVTGDGELVLDAGAGVPLSATVTGAATTPVDVRLFVATRDRAGNGFVLTYDTSAQDVIEGKLFVQPTQPVSVGKLELSTKWRLNDVDNGQTYDLLFAGPRFPASLAYRVDAAAARRLGRVQTTYRAPAKPVGYREVRFAFTDLNPVSIGAEQPVPELAPVHRTEFLTAGENYRWFQCATVTLDDAGIGNYCQAPEPYKAGATVERAWLRAPLRTTVGVTRSADALLIGMNDLAEDGPPNGTIGTFLFAERSYTLARNGRLLSEGTDPIGAREVPAGAATYRLTRTLQLQPDVLPLSTRVESSWTFTVQPPRTGRPPTIAPVVDVAVHVPVDDGNRVPAGRPLALDVDVAHPGGRLASMTVQVSTNDGATWHRLEIRQAGRDGYRATVPASLLPAGALVWLRTTARDSAGNHTEQTIHNAFAIRP